MIEDRPTVEAAQQKPQMVPVLANLGNTNLLTLFYYVPKSLVDSQRNFDTSKWTLKNFQVGRYLGGGNYGHTYLAREKKSKYVVALKIQLKKHLWKECVVSQVRREIQLHSHLKHPNIIKMFGFFHDQTRIVQILEYASGGELYERMNAQPQGRFNQRETAHYILQFIQALTYLHQMGIMHRDIKPQNILLDSQNNIKLSDFGFAALKHDRRKTYCGTLDYMSPQILSNRQYDQKVDVWCLGVLAYELAAGQPPFMERQGDQFPTEAKILGSFYKCPEYFSPQLKHFISHLLINNPSKRMSLLDAVHHPWIVQNHQQPKLYQTFLKIQEKMYAQLQRDVVHK